MKELRRQLAQLCEAEVERSLAEEALRESEERFRALLESAADSIYLVDRDCRYLFMNEQNLSRFGLPLDQVRGRTYGEFHSAEQTEDFTRKIEEVFSSGKSLWYEHRSQRDDRYFLRTLSPVKNRNGRTTAVTVVSKDITELKEAEKALRESEEKYRSLFDAVPVGIGISDFQGRVLAANPSMEKMTGFSLKDLRAIQEIYVEPGERERLLRRLAESGEVRDQEVRLKRKDGTVYFALLNMDKINLRGQDLILTTARDITARKRAERESLKYQEQLRSMASELSLAEDRERRRIAANLHDHIGQSLVISKIKLGAAHELVSSPQLAVVLDEVRRLIEKMIQETRSLTMELSPPVLYELGLDSAIAWLVEKTGGQHKLRIQVEDDGQPKPVRDDIRVVLFQAVRELLINVVKHAQAEKARVCLCREADRLRIDVEDDGVGFQIPEKEAGVDRARGFGHFSIRERLGFLGGAFEVQSEAGRGTRVTLWAPLLGPGETAPG